MRGKGQTHIKYHFMDIVYETLTEAQQCGPRTPRGGCTVRLTVYPADT